MDRIRYFGVLGFLLFFCCYACAVLKMNQIRGPSSVEDGYADELILDCDFEAEGEEDVVVKWFFNGGEEQIYQWISPSEHAFAMGPFRDVIDTSFNVTDDPNTRYRALKFIDVTPALSGNYTCKVGTDNTDVSLTKQVIVYSPATSFQLVLMGTDDDVRGNEVVFCNAANVSPKPVFELLIAGSNGSLMDLPEMFVVDRKDYSDEDGFYNSSLELFFNSSYLEEGTTKFVCQLSIPGTNYSETKTVEHDVESENDTQSAELLYEGDYSSLNSTSGNYSSLNSTSANSTDENNGNVHIQSSLLTVVFLVLSLVLAT